MSQSKEEAWLHHFLSELAKHCARKRCRSVLENDAEVAAVVGIFMQIVRRGDVRWKCKLENRYLNLCCLRVILPVQGRVQGRSKHSVAHCSSHPAQATTEKNVLTFWGT